MKGIKVVAMMLLLFSQSFVYASTKGEEGHENPAFSPDNGPDESQQSHDDGSPNSPGDVGAQDSLGDEDASKETSETETDLAVSASYHHESTEEVKDDGTTHVTESTDASCSIDCSACGNTISQVVCDYFSCSIQ
ncbi:hypothetical protein EHEL_020705 [Encephalitozoon hellem ATCC 50504]|uniref:Secreted protein n=1 Tax=Encephalitozoon hellem TaxID=27973 RepID=A0A9Q9C8W8_ENCHE|nr:uncharacterized protein EHEL_020705 [Encephalitozoon hellem ATCC 50504]AHL28911.1 hypothetical protein EHEL_020705 [Encephalitozoon hellem ATCC 50504]UTX42602.1 hypothetical protein GPU96_02g03140 [Encephalitozoon hellem]